MIKSMAHLGKVVVHRKYRRGKKRNKRRQSGSTTDLNATLERKSIICKMKIPLLILCLAVVYGACRTYEENIDLTEEIQNGDDKLDYANVPFERSLSRHRRASLLSPFTVPRDIISHLLGLDNGITTTTASSIKNIFGKMLGQKDSKAETNSLVLKAALFPFEMIKTLVSYIFQGIKIPSRALMDKMFEMGTQFFRYIFLPVLHTVLNIIDKTPITTLFPQLHAMIKAFNVLYGLLQLINYVPK